MAITVHEKAFAPTEHSFVVSGINSTSEQGYIEYSNSPDFQTSYGTPSYGIAPLDVGTNQFQFNHKVFVDPACGGPGDVIYWRWKNTSGDTREIKKIRLRRPRSDQTGWSFVVGGSSNRSVVGGLSDDFKEYCIPTALSLNPEFICVPGDLLTADTGGSLTISLTDYTSARQALHNSGVDIPVYHSPGDNELETQFFNSKARMMLMPSAGLATEGSMVIRGPNLDPQQEENTHAGSYYYFGYGNALFVFINDFREGVIMSGPTGAYATMTNFIEAALKEHRHKYKWCFTFTHTSVDANDPTSAASSTISQNAAAKTWLMNLHETYKVTAHFSGHYYGWRCRKNSNNTLYVNTTFGRNIAALTSDEWHNDMGFAHVRIGCDRFGNADPDKCNIDIIESGRTGERKTILNTNPDEIGECSASGLTVIDWKGNYLSMFNSNKRSLLIPLGSDWLYSDKSTAAAPIDFVLTRRFMESDFSPIMDNDLSVGENEPLTWKIQKAPFYYGLVSSSLETSLSGFRNNNLNTSETLTYIPLPLSWQTGTSVSNNSSPTYFIKRFDIPEDIDVTELQIIYEIEDAAYIWINGVLAWNSDGEGMPDSTSPWTITSRPELNSNKVDPNSASFASDLIVDLEPLPNQQDTGITENSSRGRRPELHYEMQAQPIRINAVDVIQSLKKRNNVISIVVLQGRDVGNAAQVSSDMAFDLELVALGENANDVFAPHIIGPVSDEQFNHGTVEIEWDINNPPTFNYLSNDPYFDSASNEYKNITYEIEYTDNYMGRETVWQTIKRRIPWSQTSYSWKVGKMVKSNSVRIRMRAFDSDAQRHSNWSISGKFAINIFELIAPAIISPVPDTLYTDFIMIILDESLTKYTYNQKIRYTLEYSSKKQNISWTKIRSNIPFGQNIIRWNIEDLAQSDDYVLRVTAKNFSTCFKATESIPDQITRRFIYNINVQQSGSFLIDTKPPDAILQIDNNDRITNQLEQTLNIFAQDETTEVVSIQLRECDASSQLSLGNLDDPYDPYGGCDPIEKLLLNNPDFNNLIGKPVTSSQKTKWVFEDKSGLRKIESVLSDSGGNLTIQNAIRIFVSAYQGKETITDFIIVVEQRDSVTINEETNPPSVVVEPAVFEVVYLSTTSGKLYVLEPFSRYLYSISGSPTITKLIEFNDSIFLFTYNSESDQGKVYRHDGEVPTLLLTFSSGLAITNGVAIFDNNLYIGLENGELWKYTGLSFSKANTFDEPINTLYSDLEYLYIGFQNSSNSVLYNGSTFDTVSLD